MTHGANLHAVANTIPDGLTAALTYASRGWPVAPAHCAYKDGACSCGDKECGKLAGKHPRTRNGLSDATTDESTIRKWWSQWPDANVLIRTGKVGQRYLVVFDVDDRHGGMKNLAALLDIHGELPSTPRGKTGGGGYHIFMWSKLPVKNSAGKIAPGLDVRGVGGYVIAPPSRHASGKEYEWEADAHPSKVVLAETPGWFVALAGLAGERVQIAPNDVRGANISEIIEGGRNDALTKIAGAMRRPGVGERAILAAIRIVNDERCKPPLDDWELERIARSIGRLEPGDPIKTTADPLPLITWAEIAKPLPPVKWTLEDLGIAPGAVTIWGGSGGGGKTMSLQAMILAIASGKPAWGQFAVKTGRAVHLDYEQGMRITRERYQRMANAMYIPLNSLPPESFGLSELPKYKMDDSQAVEDTLVRVLEGANVAVIDAFRGAFRDAKENDSEVRKHLDMLGHVSERTGCTVIVIAHSRKVSEDTDVRTALRGSSALFDAAQTVYMLDGEAGKPTRVHNTKDRVLGGINGKLRDTFGISIKDVPSPSDPRWGLAIDYVSVQDTLDAYNDGAQEESDFQSSVARILTLTTRVITYLRGKPGVEKSELMSMLGGKPNDVSTVLSNAVRDGGIYVEGTGSHALYYAL